MEYLKILQLPKAEETFRQKGEEVAAAVKRCEALVVTEDNYKEIKKIRADLRKEKELIDSEFKLAKKQILEPWTTVEEAYKKYIRDNYADADMALKQKINAIEDALKDEKETELRRYFADLAESECVPCAFEDAHIKVNLSSSMKSLKDEATAFVLKVKGDINVIAEFDNYDEILAEYMNGYDLTKAMVTISARKEAAERAKAHIEPKPEPKPEPVPESRVAEKIYSARFIVRGTAEQLKRLSKFLQTGGFEYENVKED